MVQAIQIFFQTYKDPITASVSVLAFFLSSYVFFKARKDAKIRDVLEYKSKLREWADAAIDTVSEAMYLIRLDPSRYAGFFDKRHELMWRISSLIDRGRQFLPNRDREKYGQQKGMSYRGFRHPVLDWLVLAHDLCQEINYADAQENKPLTEKFEQCRKKFVSEIQLVLDPRAELAALGNVFLLDTRQQNILDKRGYAEYWAIREWLANRKEQRTSERGPDKAAVAGSI